ncbi:MAG: DUF4230 domain-containing protein [Holdemanella sp.]|nr:DUF4230 domain-containing protein [Holdemanella sp.]
MKKIKRITFAVFVIALLVAGGYVGWKYIPKSNNIVEASDGLIPPGKTTKAILVLNEIKSSIKELAEISTYEEEYSVKRAYEEPLWLFDEYAIPFTKNYLELDCNGIIKAGYNLEDIEMNVKNGKICITLPEVKINSNELINCDFKEKNNTFNPINSTQYEELLAECKAMGLEEADKSKLYDKAEENAKKIIKDMVENISDYDVEFV